MCCECGVCQLFEKLSGVQSSTRARPPRARPADLPTFGGVEIGGLVFAAVCVVLVAAVPALVARRSAITQSRELDRFSPGLRMIRAPEDKNEPRGRATGPLLAPSKETGRGGGTMERTGAAPRSTERVSPRAVRDIARLRAKLKYRPVVFELLPPEFTLTELQRTVEAISGRHLHKQNFRRLVEAGALVEPTGEMSTRTGGRPAALFRFRREVLQERPAPGLRVRGRR